MGSLLDKKNVLSLPLASFEPMIFSVAK